MFYVYKWFNSITGEIFYIGKGTRNRYKQTRKRNKLFLEYYNNNKCNVEIIEYFEEEQKAFEKEYELICYYKDKGQCSCNLDNGGKGGCNFVWTPEKKKYYSKYNVMKNENQRKRMSINNPMKNPEINKKVAEQNKRKIILNNIVYDGEVDASKQLKVSTNTILSWCKRGYDTNGNPCRYYNEEQKKFEFKISSSKKVIIDNETFNSVKEGADYIGVWSETLIRAIKNNRKCKGHICKYANQQPSASLNDL